MVLSKKPRPLATPQADTNPTLVDAVINRGGTVGKQPSTKPVNFTLVLPAPMAQAIAKTIAARPIKQSRSQWILEAIQMRLEAGR